MGHPASRPMLLDPASLLRHRRISRQAARHSPRRMSGQVLRLSPIVRPPHSRCRTIVRRQIVRLNRLPRMNIRLRRSRIIGRNLRGRKAVSPSRRGTDQLRIPKLLRRPSIRSSVRLRLLLQRRSRRLRRRNSNRRRRRLRRKSRKKSRRRRNSRSLRVSRGSAFKSSE